jgi:hypothetical protein
MHKFPDNDRSNHKVSNGRKAKREDTRCKKNYSCDKNSMGDKANCKKVDQAQAMFYHNVSMGVLVGCVTVCSFDRLCHQVT